MARIEKSIDISAPVETVFEFAADWQNWLKFFEGVSDLKPTTEKTRGVGSRFAYKIKTLGVEDETEREVTGFVENEGWTATSIKGPQSNVQWVFARVSEKTRVTLIEEYKVPIPLVGGILDALLIKRYWETNIEKVLHNLKRLLEG